MQVAELEDLCEELAHDEDLKSLDVRGRRGGACAGQSKSDDCLFARSDALRALSLVGCVFFGALFRCCQVSGNALGTVLDPATGGAPPRPADGHPYAVTPGVAALARALRGNTALTHVDASRNGLGDYGQVV